MTFTPVILAVVLVACTGCQRASKSAMDVSSFVFDHICFTNETLASVVSSLNGEIAAETRDRSQPYIRLDESTTVLSNQVVNDDLMGEARRLLRTEFERIGCNSSALRDVKVTLEVPSCQLTGLLAQLRPQVGTRLGALPDGGPGRIKLRLGEPVIECREYVWGAREGVALRGLGDDAQWSGSMEAGFARQEGEENRMYWSDKYNTLLRVGTPRELNRFESMLEASRECIAEEWAVPLEDVAWGIRQQ